MNTEMTKAILDGRKTQTRRAITRFDVLNIDDDWQTIEFNDKKIIEKGEDGEWGKMDIIDFISSHSKYQKDEVIWVREPVEITNFIDTDVYAELSFKYIADGALGSINSDNKEEYELMDFYEEKLYGKKWVKVGARAPNGCLKEMARIFLKIIDVRVERLQDIKYEDIMNEGCNIDISDCVKHDGENQEEAINYSVYNWWIKLWNKTAPKGYKWEDNPDIFIHEFKRVNQDGSEL